MTPTVQVLGWNLGWKHASICSFEGVDGVNVGRTRGRCLDRKVNPVEVVAVDLSSDGFPRVSGLAEIDRQRAAPAAACIKEGEEAEVGVDASG